MKKLIAICCLLLMLLALLCACDENTDTQGGEGDDTHVHSYGEWSVAAKATCGAAGVEIRTCGCGESETRPIAATGAHSYGGWETVTAATCDEEGEEKRVCSCGSAETRPIAATGAHSYSSWKTVTAATCDEEGEEKRTCGCGESETRPIAATGAHSIDSTGKCTVCGTWSGTAGLKYKLDDSEDFYILTGLGTAKGDIIVAGEYNGLPVTAIGEGALKDRTAVTSVTLPNTIEKIGKNAFFGCTGLTSITIPPSVKTIGYAAFYGCTNVEEIHFNATALEGVYFYEYKTHIFPISYTHGKTLRIYIGANVTAIPDGLFQLLAYRDPNDMVVEVTFAEGSVCKTIGAGAFSDTHLTSITLPSSVTTIGENAFADTALTAIKIPASVISIGSGAFASINGSFVESITVASGNTHYMAKGNCLIEKSTGTLIVGCKNSIIPTDGSVTVIGAYAFQSCYGLSSITIPASVTAINGLAFAYCINLTEVVISRGSRLEWIGGHSFDSCPLTSMMIPATVTYLSDEAFDGCNKLKTFYFGGEKGTSFPCSYFYPDPREFTVYYYSAYDPYYSGDYWHYNEQGEIEIWP